MSACFYNNTGVMAGVDMHGYIALGPLGVPLPLSHIPHGVAALFRGPSWDGKKRTASVHADGVEMVQLGFKCALVPHVPLAAPPPHPTEAALLAATIVFSSSAAAIGVSTVTAEGKTLACCIFGPAGLNANCGMSGGVVYNSSTVITSPTAADFASAAASWVFGQVVGKIAGKLLPKITNPFEKNLVKKILKDRIKEFLTEAKNVVTVVTGA